MTRASITRALKNIIFVFIYSSVQHPALQKRGHSFLRVNYSPVTGLAGKEINQLVVVGHNMFVRYLSIYFQLAVLSYIAYTVQYVKFVF